MIVIGIRMKPAPALAIAPVVRFARFESFGKLEEWFDFAVFLSSTPTLANKFDRATSWRKALRDVKYMAEPKPVRRAEGSVPRQKLRIEGEGPEEDMDRMVVKREVDPDCCMRVLRRSAG